MHHHFPLWMIYLHCSSHMKCPNCLLKTTNKSSSKLTTTLHRDKNKSKKKFPRWNFVFGRFHLKEFSGKTIFWARSPSFPFSSLIMIEIFLRTPQNFLSVFSSLLLASKFHEFSWFSLRLRCCCHFSNPINPTTNSWNTSTLWKVSPSHKINKCFDERQKRGQTTFSIENLRWCACDVMNLSWWLEKLFSDFSWHWMENR